MDASPQLTNIGDDAQRGQGSVATRSDLMKTLWILAAAATFAACHNRSQDETGAAPDKGAVKTDTSTTPKPSTGYDTTSTAQPTAPPSTGVDTTAKPTAPPSTGMDTTSAQPTAPPSAGGYDTTSTANPSAGVGTDTTMSPKAGGTTSDSASTQR
jgi:hypothetical protein